MVRLTLAAVALTTVNVYATLPPRVPGMPAQTLAYVRLHGEPSVKTNGPLDGRTLQWDFEDRSLFGKRRIRLEVVDRNGQVVEERWTLLDDDRWPHDDLWAILDAKGGGYRIHRRSEFLVEPWQSLLDRSVLLVFTRPQADAAAQLQNSPLGPRVRVLSLDWGRALAAEASRSRTAVTTSRTVTPSIEPRMRDTSLTSVITHLRGGTVRECPPRGRCQAWRAVSGGATLQRNRTAAGVEIVVRIPQRASWERLDSAVRLPVSRTDPSTVLATLEKVLSEFRPRLDAAFPGLLDPGPWERNRLAGAFPPTLANDVARANRLAEFVTLVERAGPDGVRWKLDLVSQGYKLRIRLPPPAKPRR